MLSAETHRGNREASGQESYGRFLYNLHRYYSPEIGRYISADAMGQSAAFASGPFDSGGLNLYGYTSNDPINYVDPTGNAKIKGVLGEPIYVHPNDPDPFPSRPHGHIGSPTSRYKVDVNTGKIYHGTQKTGQKLSSKQLAKLRGALGRLGLLGLAAAIVADPSSASAAVLQASPVGLVADAFLAYADYFLGAAGSPGQACEPAGGPPGGDELAGQFLGGYGAFNRR